MSFDPEHIEPEVSIGAGDDTSEATSENGIVESVSESLSVDELQGHTIHVGTVG